jgi:hypothetical protein
MEAPSLADQQRVWVCGRWALCVGCWALGVGRWALGVGVGCWLLGVGCWVLGVGRWVLGVGCWALGVHSRFQFSPFLLSLSAVIQGTDLPFLFGV